MPLIPTYDARSHQKIQVCNKAEEDGKCLVGMYCSSVCPVLCQLQHGHIVSVFSILGMLKLSLFSYFANNFAFCIFTARPKAQRCQVTPYVVNVLVVVGGVTDS